MDPPKIMDPSIAPSPLNRSSSSTSVLTSQVLHSALHPHSRSCSQVTSQSLPPPVHLARDRSKQLKALILAKTDQKDRLASLLRSPTDSPTNPSIKTRPPVEPIRKRVRGVGGRSSGSSNIAAATNDFRQIHRVCRCVIVEKS